MRETRPNNTVNSEKSILTKTEKRVKNRSTNMKFFFQKFDLYGKPVRLYAKGQT